MCFKGDPPVDQCRILNCIAWHSQQLSPFVKALPMHCHFRPLMNTSTDTWPVRDLRKPECSDGMTKTGINEYTQPFCGLPPYSSTKRALARNNLDLMLVLRYIHFQIVDERMKADLALLRKQRQIDRHRRCSSC